MATKERLIIVGGDAAGMSAAAQARRMRDDLEIISELRDLQFDQRGDLVNFEPALALHV